MTKQEIIIYLNTLIDSDIPFETKIVLREAVAKLEKQVTLEEWTQIVLLLASVLVELRKT